MWIPQGKSILSVALGAIGIVAGVVTVVAFVPVTVAAMVVVSEGYWSSHTSCKNSGLVFGLFCWGQQNDRNRQRWKTIDYELTRDAVI